MNFNEVRTIVREYVGNAVAEVDQHIVDAVNFLSFVFPIKKIDSSQVTVKDQDYIDKPDNCLKILRVEIDGDEIPEAVTIENLESPEDEEIARWFIFDDKIQLTKKMDEDGQTIKIWFRANYYVDSGGNWVESQPAGDDNFYWRCVASDDSGSNLIAGRDVGRLYTSSDGGINWTERQPAGAVNKLWMSVASDADGSNLIVCVENGRLYTSSDGGINWTERQPAGAVNKNWRTVASDSDGSNLIVSIDGGRLYTSDDFGATWTERQPAGAVDIDWMSVDSDADGSNLIVGIDSGRLYTSDDSGATWTERQPAGAVDKRWVSVVSDSDGSNLIAAAYAGRLYISNDSGANWTESGKWGVPLDWMSIASDADGSNLISCIHLSRLFIFSDDLEIDVSDELGELVYVGGAYRYYRKVVSTKVMTPASYPDIELDEVRKVLDQWQDDYYKLLENFIKHK